MKCRWSRSHDPGTGKPCPSYRESESRRLGFGLDAGSPHRIPPPSTIASGASLAALHHVMHPPMIRFRRCISSPDPSSPSMVTAAAATISKLVAEAGPSPSPPARRILVPSTTKVGAGRRPSRPASWPGHRAATRYSSSAAAVFERRFVSAGHGKELENILYWENGATKQVEIQFKTARVLQVLFAKTSAEQLKRPYSSAEQLKRPYSSAKTSA